MADLLMGSIALAVAGGAVVAVSWQRLRAARDRRRRQALREARRELRAIDERIRRVHAAQTETELDDLEGND